MIYYRKKHTILQREKNILFTTIYNFTKNSVLKCSKNHKKYIHKQSVIYKIYTVFTRGYTVPVPGGHPLVVIQCLCLRPRCFARYHPLVWPTPGPGVVH